MPRCHLRGGALIGSPPLNTPNGNGFPLAEGFSLGLTSPTCGWPQKGVLHIALSPFLPWIGAMIGCPTHGAINASTLCLFLRLASPRSRDEPHDGGCRHSTCCPGGPLRIGSTIGRPPNILRRCHCGTDLGLGAWSVMVEPQVKSPSTHRSLVSRDDSTSHDGTWGDCHHHRRHRHRHRDHIIIITSSSSSSSSSSASGYVFGLSCFAGFFHVHKNIQI